MEVWYLLTVYIFQYISLVLFWLLLELKVLLNDNYKNNFHLMMAQMMESMREYTEAVTDSMKESMQNVTIKIGKREFGRTVKEVNA